MVPKRPRPTTTIVSVASIVALACASAPKAEPDYGAGLRYGAECAPARERVRAAPAPPEVVAPRPVELFIPPLPVPDRVRGDTARITVRVDSAGYPVQGSIQIAGIDDQRYVARMRTVIERIRYRPAALDGCAVEGTAQLTYTF